MNCAFDHMTSAYLTRDLGDGARRRYAMHLPVCDSCRTQIHWETNLISVARKVGSTLERESLARPRRVRPRWAAAAVALFLVAASVSFVLTWPDTDPAADIASQYADLERMEGLLPQTEWDPETRATYRDAVTKIDHAIQVSKDAVRTSPRNRTHVELCHMAYRAKARLINSYLNR